jgi:hypothetical protein
MGDFSLRVTKEPGGTKSAAAARRLQLPTNDGMSNGGGASGSRVSTIERQQKEMRTKSLQAVKAYWKDEVGKDPMAILSLTDIPLKQLRAHSEAVHSRGANANAEEDNVLMRKCIAERIGTGQWRVWRCCLGETCASGGLHLTSQQLFRCLEKHIPRDVKREEAGDARAWLLPMALPADVNLAGYIGGGVGALSGGGGENAVAPRMLSRDAETRALASAAGSEAGSSSGSEDGDGGGGGGGGGFINIEELAADPRQLVGGYVTPAQLANAVGGRPAPLLSADCEVLRAEAGLYKLNPVYP